MEWRAPKDWYCLGLLLCLVTLAWCAAYNRWTLETWKTPVSYSGDTWGSMAAAKTFATGDMAPILPKYPLSLGAPFVANWNDHPIGEEGILVWYAVFVRLFGVFAGSNLALLSAHLLAAGSFYFVCRALRYQKIWSFTAAILFSMSGFAFARSLPHLVLTFYWHVPLGLLVAWWCVSTRAYADKRKRIICVVVSVLFGIQYAYYTGMFLQFLVIAALVCFIRRNGTVRVLFPLGLAGVTFATVVLMNVDTLYYRLVNGANPAAVVRIYSGLEVYALRPVELLLPAAHRWGALQAWTNRAYHSQTMFQGEKNSPYLGFIAIIGLVWLLWVSIRAIIGENLRAVPIHFWGIVWVLLFSVVGGLNGLLGVFGLVLFRGTNRYSIVILALVLLFLVRELTRLTRKWHYAPTLVSAGLLLLVGLWDQVPRPPTYAGIHQVRQQVISDGQIVSSLEAKLPPRAMIFELPVVDYPEVGPVGAMLDYEHFRPYLQSRSLRYSYGSQKGRTRERWQSEVMQFGSTDFVDSLEKYGFSALLINKKAYADRAASLLADLRLAGRSEILAESDDLVSIALRPDEHPALPPEFDQNWYEREGTKTEHWRWSKGDAKLILYNAESQPKTVHLVFGLGSIQSRRLDLYLGSAKVYSTSIALPVTPDPVDLTLSLRPGRNEVSFRTDRAAELPGNGDSRKLSFRIRNFELKE